MLVRHSSRLFWSTPLIVKRNVWCFDQTAIGNALIPFWSNIGWSFCLSNRDVGYYFPIDLPFYCSYEEIYLFLVWFHQGIITSIKIIAICAILYSKMPKFYMKRKLKIPFWKRIMPIDYFGFLLLIILLNYSFYRLLIWMGQHYCQCSGKIKYLRFSIRQKLHIT